MDLISKDRLGKHIEQNDEVLRRAVEDVYYGNNLEVSIKPVKTLSDTSYNQQIQLRLKNLNTDYSQKYKDAIGISNEPVVMSGGLFSDLNTFEDFGEDLVEEGHDVWLIEMNGGPFTDWYLDSDNDNYAYDLNSAQIYNQCNRPTNHKLWNELESVEDCDDNNPL